MREPVPEAACSDCKQLLPASAFWRSRHNASGLQSSCKKCTGARKAAVFYPVTLTEKTCRDCGEAKPASEFCIDNKRKGGLRSECRPCTSVRQRASVYKIPHSMAKSLVGKDACEICSSPFKSHRDKHVDHCHSTGRVRGVLCRACNSLLGEAKDSPINLSNAIKYLQRTASAVRGMESPCG
jgi:hypothetical protein